VVKNIKQHIFHWIAILSILMAAVAPTISQAVAVSETGKGFTVEICMANGQKMVQTIDTDSQQISDMKHCPYCTLQPVYTVTVNTQLDFSQPLAANLYPQLFYQSPQPLFAWVKLPSQAPPQLA
jgi:hypothetical protein